MTQQEPMRQVMDDQRLAYPSSDIILICVCIYLHLYLYIRCVCVCVYVCRSIDFNKWTTLVGDADDGEDHTCMEAGGI